MSTIVHHFANNQLPGYTEYYQLTVTTDFAGVWTHVPVAGQGSDRDSVDVSDPANQSWLYHRIYAEYDVFTAFTFPPPDPTLPGWSGPVIYSADVIFEHDDIAGTDLTANHQASDYAYGLARFLYFPRVSISFLSPIPLLEGEVIDITDPVQWVASPAVDYSPLPMNNYVVPVVSSVEVQVEFDGGTLTVWQIQAQRYIPTLDELTGGSFNFYFGTLVGEGIRRNRPETGVDQFKNPTTALGAPLSNWTLSSYRNVMQGYHDGVTSAVFNPATNQSMRTPAGQPIGIDPDNFIQDTAADPNDIVPEALANSPAGTPIGWARGNRTGPNDYPFALSSNQPAIPLPLATDTDIMSFVLKKEYLPDLVTTVDPPTTALTVDVSWRRAGEPDWHTPLIVFDGSWAAGVTSPINNQSPLPLRFEDEVVVRAHNLPAGHIITMVALESGAKPFDQWNFITPQP